MVQTSASMIFCISAMSSNMTTKCVCMHTSVLRLFASKPTSCQICKTSKLLMEMLPCFCMPHFKKCDVLQSNYDILDILHCHHSGQKYLNMLIIPNCIHNYSRLHLPITVATKTCSFALSIFKVDAQNFVYKFVYQCREKMLEIYRYAPSHACTC